MDYKFFFSYAYLLSNSWLHSLFNLKKYHTLIIAIFAVYRNVIVCAANEYNGVTQMTPLLAVSVVVPLVDSVASTHSVAVGIDV